MRVLMLSEDPNIFVPGSEARNRMEHYAATFGELHVVAFARPGAAPQQVDPLFLYPASGNHLNRRRVLYRTTATLLKKEKFDVMTVQSPNEIGWIASVLSRRHKVPLQIQVHTDVASPWYRRASAKEYARWLLARRLLPRADCLRVVSERIKKNLAANAIFRHSAERAVVLPVFTDLGIFFNAEPSSDERFSSYRFKMVAVGRFVEKEKNFSLLIRMMRLVIKECPDALLVLIGAGPDEAVYRRLIATYHLERSILIEPWRNDLPSFLKQFDLFLLSSNYEGWSRSVIEAMAAQLPVVMTDVGLAGEVLKNRENGRVVPVGDKTAFASACLDFYRDPQERERFKKAGFDTVRNLKPSTWEEYLAAYSRSLQSCV